MNIVTINPNDYKPHPKNPNEHPQIQLTELGQSIDKFGQFKNIVVWQGFYLAGHGLVEAAKQKGITELYAYDMSHLSEEDAMALMVADNELPKLSMLNLDLMRNLLGTMSNRPPGVTQNMLSRLGLSQNNNQAKPSIPALPQANPSQDSSGNQDNNQGLPPNPFSASMQNVEFPEYDKNIANDVVLDTPSPQPKANVILCPHCGKEIAL